MDHLSFGNHLGITAFGIIGGIVFFIALVMPYRADFRFYFFIFLFTVIPLGRYVMIPLGLVLLSSFFKKKAPKGFAVPKSKDAYTSPYIDPTHKDYPIYGAQEDD